MTDRSYYEKLIGTRGDLVHRIKAKDSTGRWAYYFVYVRENREAGFLKALDESANLNLEDYGDVLASCYGEQPTPDVLQYLRDRYGFELNA